MAVIGKSVPRIDAFEKVTGTADFPGDLNHENQLYMKILFSHRPHAIIKSVDITQANELPGVIKILLASDVPNNEYGMIIPDQPVLCGVGTSKPYADRVRFVGDQVAAVVAETQLIATRAIDLIDVQYEDLPGVYNVEDALTEDSILVHPDRDTNIFCHYQIRKGDLDDPFRDADVIIEAEYQTPSQEHAFLQPEAGFGYIDSTGLITIEAAGQWVHEERKQIAHALNVDEDEVRVIHPHIGGAFGGREDLSVQIVLALAVKNLSDEDGIEKPIKIVWSREESIIGHHKRHPYKIKAKWGATSDGMLVAAEMKVLADGGAYAYTSTKVLGNATLMCTGPYEIPNVVVDSYAIYTNNIPSGAFRGFGSPQGAFAAESQINKLAEALDMDPFEIRLKNVLREGSLLSAGTPLPPGVSLPDVVKRCEEEAKLLPKLEDQEVIKTGIGVACGFKNVGFSFGFPEHSWAKVEIYGEDEIEFVKVHHAGAEVGQGAHTVMSQFAADALSVPLSYIKLVTADSSKTEDSGSSSASRMTFMSGNAIKGAARSALSKWKNGENPAVSSYQYKPPPTTPYDTRTGKSEPNFSYGYVAQVVVAHVNTQTGKVWVSDVISVNDVGKAVNPQQIEGQIEGAVVQAIGYSIYEEFKTIEGFPITDKLSTYLIPSILDIPSNIKSVILEYPDPRGPEGARGVGEMPFIPIAPAITHAVQQATGIWFDEFPLTPDRVLKGINNL